MYILIYNSNEPFSIGLSEAFILINTQAIYSLKDEQDYLFATNQEEFYLNVISESLDNSSYEDAKAIIIDKNLGGSGWQRAIGLAGHIACSDYSKCALNRVPIILTDWTNFNIEDPSLKVTTINNIFQTEGFYFRKYEDLFSKKAVSITGELKYLIDIEITRLKSVDFKNISIKSVYDSSHQATNEWGAMQLAANFGIFDLIKFSYPKHLYFKYLSRFIKNNHVPPDLSLNNLFNKILLIDDNADCGWVELLGHIHNCQVDKITSAEILNIWQNVTPEKFDNYELIYLDLYLEKGKTDSARALSALRFIKLKFPHIPVIIFTASDKAWNLDKILEKGADAMYIKESPLYYRNEEYSLKNYEDFKTTVRYVHDKYKILRPYWLYIRKIVNHSTFQTIENSPRKIRDRIVERLRMFYGLLKKGYEQWDYDKQTFFYDDYELAFMTLWSVLNEIQEAFYEKKEISIIHSDGITYFNHPNHGRTPLSYKKQWIVKKNGKIFIDNSIIFAGSEINGTPKLKNSGRYEITADESISDLLYDRNTYPYFSIDTTGAYRPNKEVLKSLASQIAYLLLNNPTHTSVHLGNLFRLGEIRNSMYLTHGNSFDINFFSQTERSKRTNSTITPTSDIKELFDLVTFLLTDELSYMIVF